MDEVDRDVVLGYEVLHHRVSTLTAETFIVGLVAGAVGVTFHGDHEALVGFDIGNQLGEVGLGVRRENMFVESEGNADRRLELIVVDIGDCGPEVGQAKLGLITHLGGLGHGVGGVLVGGGGVLVGDGGMLVGTGGAFLRGRDAGLRLLIHLFHLGLCVFDLLAVLSGLLPHLIHFSLDRSGGVAHVLFGRAATRQQGTRNDARGKENSHKSQNLECYYSKPRAVVIRPAFSVPKQRR